MIDINDEWDFLPLEASRGAKAVSEAKTLVRKKVALDENHGCKGKSERKAILYNALVW